MIASSEEESASRLSDHAAIGAQNLAVDPAAVRAGEKGNRGGDILGHAETLQRVSTAAYQAAASEASANGSSGDGTEGPGFGAGAGFEGAEPGAPDEGEPAGAGARSGDGSGAGSSDDDTVEGEFKEV